MENDEIPPLESEIADKVGEEIEEKKTEILEDPLSPNAQTPPQVEEPISATDVMQDTIETIEDVENVTISKSFFQFFIFCFCEISFLLFFF